MKKTIKRIKKIKKKCSLKKRYNNLEEVIDIIKKMSLVKFNESIDIAINLGIDSKKNDQNVKGIIILPYNINKKTKIAVFAQKSDVKMYKYMKKDHIIGINSITKKIQKKNFDFDTLITTKEYIKKLIKFAPILGPRNLMPNVKFGTITNDINKTINNIISGQIKYKNDKNGIIHSTIGKISFENFKIKENFYKFIDVIKKNKPNNSKGIYIKKVSMSSTMGLSFNITNLI
ncbi:50S ribosomal protein L1 [Buchnera aphidicola (Taiwanaphis decaspermi)]|uniref:50S ribosomal protein L1 n=1 Tax=Buchnera aphidicola TaxID=9 RepID=UPI0031B7FC48